MYKLIWTERLEPRRDTKMVETIFFLRENYETCDVMWKHSANLRLTGLQISTNQSTTCKTKETFVWLVSPIWNFLWIHSNHGKTTASFVTHRRLDFLFQVSCMLMRSWHGVGENCWFYDYFGHCTYFMWKIILCEKNECSASRNVGDAQQNVPSFTEEEACTGNLYIKVASHRGES